MFLRITAYGASHQVRLYSVTNVGFRLFVLQTFIFLGCLVSFVLKILYLFLYAIFKVHVSPATRYPDSFCKESGSHLLSHAVSSIVPSAA